MSPSAEPIAAPDPRPARRLEVGTGSAIDKKLSAPELRAKVATGEDDADGGLARFAIHCGARVHHVAVASANAEAVSTP